MKRIFGIVTVCASMVACGAPSGGAAPAKKEGPIVLVDVESQVPMFDDELDSLREQARAFLLSQGLRVVPQAEIDELRRLGSEHRARRDGPVCERSPSFASLLMTRYGPSPRAHLSFRRNDAGGFASLRLGRPTTTDPYWSPENDLAEWSGWAKAPLSIDDWARMVATLAPYRPWGGGGLEPKYGPVALPIEIESARVGIREVTTAGDWAATLPRAEDFSDVLSSLDGCHDPRWHALGGARTVLGVGGEGKVERCFMEPDDGRPQWENQARIDCACFALSRMRFGLASNASRRVAFRLSNRLRFPEMASARFGLRATFGDVRGMPPGYDGRAALEDAVLDLSACAQHHRQRDIRAPIRIEIDGTGRVVAARLKGDDAELAECVEGVFSRIWFPCTETGAPITIDATFATFGR